jgi:hypothetical protein
LNNMMFRYSEETGEVMNIRWGCPHSVSFYRLAALKVLSVVQ